MTILSLVGAASSATSLEYKIVFEMLGVLLPPPPSPPLLLPLLPSLAQYTAVAGDPGQRRFELQTVPRTRVA